MFKGTVAIVGRPNVGKSTLFNRLTRCHQAIVDDRPGVTRDRLYGLMAIGEDDSTRCLLIDTGGFETKELYFQPFAKNIVWEQTELAIEEADMVLLLFDAHAGLHPHDEQLATYLKKLDKKTIYVANKVDGVEHVGETYDFFKLGIDEVLPVSAAHNRGISHLVEIMEQGLDQIKPAHKHAMPDADAIKIALIGQPNVGKSSILNRLCGFERSLVSDVAGTTRDVIDTPITYNQKHYVILDTAGIRRRARISDKLESLCSMFSLRAIENADIVLVIIDAQQGLNDQDARLISLAVENCRPVLILVNKWDLIADKKEDSSRKYEAAIRHKIADATFIPIMFVSCLHNQRIAKVMSMVEKLHEKYVMRVSTAKVNDALETIVNKHTPQVLKTLRKRIKFYYASQVSASPPTFVIMTNYAHEIQHSYKRYISNKLREEFGFDAIPIRVLYRNKNKGKNEARQ